MHLQLTLRITSAVSAASPRNSRKHSQMLCHGSVAIRSASRTRSAAAARGEEAIVAGTRSVVCCFNEPPMPTIGVS